MQWGWKPRPKRLQAGQYNLKSCSQAIQSSLKPELVPGKEALSLQGHPPNQMARKEPWEDSVPLPGLGLLSAHLLIALPGILNSVTQRHRHPSLALGNPSLPVPAQPGSQDTGSGGGEARSSFFLPSESSEDTYRTKRLHLFPSHSLSLATCYALRSKVKVKLLSCD